jgi:hypothetical protein
MKNYKTILVLLVLILLVITVTACTGGHDVEEVRSKIEEELYQEYDKEFVVDRIGTRSSNGDEFYQARIYPKSILGTPKEGDKYYYGKASIEKEMFGLADGVADTYGELKRSIEIENRLLDKAKEFFGERVLLKVEQRYEKRNSNGYFVSYLDPSYKEVMKRIEKEPTQHRLLLDLDAYIFDRIENKEEKEKRREDIFEFVQYLKEEGLFDYLEMGIVFIDERVLAPSYDKFARELYFADKEEKEIAGKSVRMPPIRLRKSMSKKLQEEIKKISEKDLLANMNKIRKEELSYQKIGKYNEQYFVWICSLKMLKEKYKKTYRKYKKKNKLAFYYYKSFANDNKYMYIN